MSIQHAGDLGDRAAGAVVDLMFTSADDTASGAPATVTGGAVSVYKNNSTTQSTAGVTLTADFDGVTGLNHVRITTVTDGSFYAAGNEFIVVLTSGTVNGVTHAGYALASFGLANRPLQGVGASVITATSIASDAITDAKVASDVTIASVTGAVGSVTGNVGGNVTGSVGSVASGGITAASLAADAITAAKIADGAIDAATFASGAITAAAIATDAIGSAEIAATAIAKIADAVLRRQCDNAEASSDGDALDLSSLYGLIQQAQESAIASTTLTVKKTDGTTTLGTKTVAVNSDGHITGIS